MKTLKTVFYLLAFLFFIYSCRTSEKDENLVPIVEKTKTLESANTRQSAKCPSGWKTIICGGKSNCYPSSYSCCGQKIISSGHCIYCNGYVGVPNGYTCCNGKVIDDKSACIYCNNQYMTVPKGGTCCLNNYVPPGKRCVNCNGKLHIVNTNCRCVNNAIKCG